MWADVLPDVARLLGGHPPQADGQAALPRRRLQEDCQLHQGTVHQGTEGTGCQHGYEIKSCRMGFVLYNCLAFLFAIHISEPSKSGFDQILRMEPYTFHLFELYQERDFFKAIL